jgi:predicted nucleic acid-binding protein
LRLVIADTGPLNYLIQIRQIELLPRLFERVAIPNAVTAELSHPLAPASVRDWIHAPPVWLEVHHTGMLPGIADLDEGEAAAISLALSIQADLVLIDERAGVQVARTSGLRVTGTLGILDLAAERGLIVFADAISELERTSFRRPTAVLNALLAKHQNS